MRDWELVRHLIDENEDADAIIERAKDMPNRGRHLELGLLFQDYLYALVVAEKAQVIVETGVRTGVSTKYLLAGLVANGEGTLYSCDPCYPAPDYAQLKLRETVQLNDSEIAHWKFLPGKSINVLGPLEAALPPWDIFLHDGDHAAGPMTEDLESAWRAVKPGGLIICDDWTFPLPDAPPHGAWTRFVTLHGLEGKDCGIIGSAAVARKPLTKDRTGL